MIANQYRDTLKMLEKDHNSTRLGSIKNAAAKVQITQEKQKCLILLSPPLGLRVCQSEFMTAKDAWFFNAHACRVFCQAVARGLQELQAEMHQIAQELVLIHRDEAALQSVSEFMEQRLLQSCEDLDIAERELGVHACACIHFHVIICVDMQEFCMQETLVRFQ